MGLVAAAAAGRLCGQRAARLIPNYLTNSALRRNLTAFNPGKRVLAESDANQQASRWYKGPDAENLAWRSVDIHDRTAFVWHVYVPRFTAGCLNLEQ